MSEFEFIEQNNKPISPTLPPDVIDRVLFSHPFQDLGKPFPSPLGAPISDGPFPTTVPDYTFQFRSELFQDINAQVSYGFSSAAQLASINAMTKLMDKTSATSPRFRGTTVPEPMISLYYPGDGCHDIIDAAVKVIAQEQLSDVVVVDAIDLAMGKHSPLGKALSNALELLYTSHSSLNIDYDSELEEDEYTADDLTIQSAFDALALVGQGTSKAKERNNNSTQNGSGTCPSVQCDTIFGNTIQGGLKQAKRIIYVRAFGSIAPFAERILDRLLRAAHARRIINFSNGKGNMDVDPTLVQPTIIVLGYTKLNTPVHPIPPYSNPWGTYPTYNSAGPDQSSAFVSSGVALRERLPRIGNSFAMSDSPARDLPSLLSPLSKSFFITSLGSQTGVTCRNIWPGKLFTHVALELYMAPCYMSVFTQEANGISMPKVETDLDFAWRGRVGNAWLKISLAQAGATISKVELELQSSKPIIQKSSSSPILDASQVMQKMDWISYTTILHDLNHIAKTAVGLSSPSHTTITYVSPSTLSKAYQIFVDNNVNRTSWNKDRHNYGAWVAPWEMDHASDFGVYKKEEIVKPVDQKEEQVGDPVVNEVRASKDLSKCEQALLGCIVSTDDLGTSLEDFCVAPQMIESLRNIINLPLLFPEAFGTGILAREATEGVLLYGPPGTEKTLLCRAVARQCNARVLLAKPSDLLSVYLGEAENPFKALFSLARRLSPCIIFIDEVDSCFPERKENVNKWDRNILSEFLQSMDDLLLAKHDKELGVVVIGASNRPYDIDHAVLQRLPSRLYLDLPGNSEREQMLKLHLQGEKFVDDVNLKDFAALLGDYSGSDIKNLCMSAAKEAAKEAVREFMWAHPKAQSQSKTAVDSTESNNQDTPNANNRKITWAHLLHAMDEILPSVTPNGYSELLQWHAQFGKRTAIAFPGFLTGRQSSSSINEDPSSQEDNEER